MVAVGLSNFYDDGTQLPLLDPWVIQENKWRATRYGLDADIIVDEGGTTSFTLSLKHEPLTDG